MNTYEHMYCYCVRRIGSLIASFSRTFTRTRALGFAPVVFAQHSAKSLLELLWWSSMSVAESKENIGSTFPTSVEWKVSVFKPFVDQRVHATWRSKTWFEARYWKEVA
jgi:hypothetical protein